MAFDKSKDVAVKTWELHDEESDTTLHVSIHRYNEGDPKLQIGPRTFTNKKGEEKFRKAGRLTAEESFWLLGLADEIRTAFDD